MNKRLGIVGVCVCFLAATAAVAGSTATSVAVKEAAVNRAYGNYVFIHLSSPSVGSPSCATNTYWNYTLSLDGLASRELYALLLTAASSGKLVTMAGTGICSEFPYIESLQSINFLI